MLEALLVPVKMIYPVRLEEINGSLAILQSLVCGNVESISFKDWHVYLNDEGEHIPLLLNHRADVLIREAGVDLEWSVSGDAVFLGHDTNGDEADVPAHLLELAAILFDTPLEA